jgi:hypothetical protein
MGRLTGRERNEKIGTKRRERLEGREGIVNINRERRVWED